MTGSIPVFLVEGEGLAEAWEKALLKLHRQGCEIKTEYDKPGDPPSKDCSMTIVVRNPLAEPMIHRDFPGGLEDLQEYVLEVTEGIKDHCVREASDPTDTRWEYTYHGRLAAYGSWQELHDGKSTRAGGFTIDQIEAVIAKLVAQPFTRQAQMITWMPNLDLDCYDPPCLQSIWYRILEDETDGTWWLNCNIRFRSNDAWGASFMNLFGFIMFNRDVIAAEVAKRSGHPVKLGRLNWQADSYHIYGKDLAAAKARLFDRLATAPFESRVYQFSDELIQDIYQEAEAAIRLKIADYDREH